MTLATGTHFRHPAVLAKTVTTLDVLRRHCDTAGTDFDRIERTCVFAFAADDNGPKCAELVKQLSWLAGLGIDTVIGRIEGLEQRTPVEQLARYVIPAVAELSGRR